MRKLYYIYLKSILSVCILFRLTTTQNLSLIGDLKLNYYRSGFKEPFYLGSSKGERKENMKFKLNLIDQTKNVILYKIHLRTEHSTNDGYSNQLLMSIEGISKNYEIMSFLLPKPKIYTFHDSNLRKEVLVCNLFICHIGIVYQRFPGKFVYGRNNPLFFYIGFTKSNEYDNVILKFIPKINNNKYVFRIIVCPGLTWLTSYSNSEYVETSDNYIGKLDREKISGSYILKYMYCNESGVTTFVKCGYLKQMHMPSIDVGYECSNYNDKKNISIRNVLEEETNMSSLSSGELVCDKTVINEPSSLVIDFLPPGNYYNNVNAFKIGRFTINTKLYSGHRLHCVSEKKISQMESEFISSFGYELDYEAKCKVPPLNATLRLKVNGIVQEFENKTDGNFGKMNTYTFDRREMKDASFGCHAIPDEMKRPIFSDFYELFYPTSLLMLDETGQHYIEVNNMDSLVSNRKYKCTLKDANSKIKKTDYIKETEFIISLTGGYSYIWIIFGVFIVVTALLIAGLVIFKKLQLKKKKQNNSLSTSSSQSTSTSSTVISKVSNIQIIQNKNVAPKSTNMGKTVVNKNANINNKITNLEQKVAIKNSNLNLANQAKNAPKKVVGKNSNQKKISNMEDSVFKVK